MSAQTQTSTPSSSTRRDELLKIAAELFATKGFKNTTVRDIADAAGILSGSLYHHFDSKESMVDEILSSFQEELFGKYAEIIAGSADPRAKLEEAVRVSFEAIDHHRDEVAIFQNEADYLGTFDRFDYLADAQPAVPRRLADPARRGRPLGRLAQGPRRRAGVPLHPRHGLGGGALVPTRRQAQPPRRGRPVPHHPSRRDHRYGPRDSPTPTSSTPSGHRSASAAARSPTCTRPTSAATC